MQQEIKKEIKLSHHQKLQTLIFPLNISNLINYKLLNQANRNVLHTLNQNFLLTPSIKFSINKKDPENSGSF